MKRSIQVKNVGGRPTSGLYAGERLICELKSTAVLFDRPDYMAPIDENAPFDEKRAKAFLETRGIQMETRTVTGIMSILGVVDTVNDRINPSAFTKTIDEQLYKARRIRHLWNHDQMNPPIATLKSARVLTREQSPESIKSAFPDMMGCVEVSREYHDFPLADSVYKNLVSGGLNEMSFGFVPTKFSFEQEEEEKPLWDAVRVVDELKWYESSDVHWGANEGTMAVVGANPVENWKSFVDQLRALKQVDPDEAAVLMQAVEEINRALSTKAEAEPADQKDPDKPKGESVDNGNEASLQIAAAKARIMMFDLEV